MQRRIILLACLLALSACEKKTSTDVPMAGSITESVEGSTTKLFDEPDEVAPQVAPAQTCATAECEKACADVRPAFAKDCPWAYNVGCFDGTAPAGFPCDSFTKRDQKANEGAAPADQERGIEVPKGEAPAARKKSIRKRKAKLGNGDDSPDFKPTPIGD